MTTPQLHAFFVFDAAYLGPALVSVTSFLQQAGATRWPVTMVYLRGNSNTDDQKRALLLRFQEGLKLQHPDVALQLVELQGNVFDDYVQRHHFSNAILYKAILPQAFAQVPHIVLFDCGMIFGRQVVDFLAAIKQGICDSSLATVTAYCVPANQAPPGLWAERHHTLYPGAGILYFDVRRYLEASIYARFVAGFRAHRDQLVYAEQDLLHLILEEAELGAFEEYGVRRHIDMAGAPSWATIHADAALIQTRDFFYLKHVGSFKPWKRWVLHPSKALYLRELQGLQSCIGDDGLALLQDDALFPEQMGYLAQQLLALESHYAHSSSL